jgi:hypothetical protein
VQLLFLLWQRLGQQRQRAVLKVLPSGASRAILLDTMEFWELRLAALSDVTKQTSATGCKKTIPINLTANSEMERSASSANAAQQHIPQEISHGE